MKTTATQLIFFQVEPADRSVGIMSEGFSAWFDEGDCWCELSDIQPPKFAWYDNNGNNIEDPTYHRFLEAMLLAYAEAWYENQDGS
jgi:hypothetical protein